MVTVLRSRSHNTNFHRPPKLYASVRRVLRSASDRTQHHSSETDIRVLCIVVSTLSRQTTLGNYADGELAVVKTVDADNRTVLTFTDWKGNKVLERHIIDEKDGVMADTYYVYDALGKLRFVLPPALNGMTRSMVNSLDIRSCEVLRRYAYFYRYDNRMLLVEKKLPGAAPVYYINDITGAPVFSQDGNLRNVNRWKFSIPDRFGRPVLEGLCDAPDAAAVKQMFVHVYKTDFANTASSICGTGYCPNIALIDSQLL